MVYPLGWFKPAAFAIQRYQSCDIKLCTTRRKWCKVFPTQKGGFHKFYHMVSKWTIPTNTCKQEMKLKTSFFNFNSSFFESGCHLLVGLTPTKREGEIVVVFRARESFVASTRF